jgi:hypothetical protein
LTANAPSSPQAETHRKSNPKALTESKMSLVLPPTILPPQPKAATA